MEILGETELCFPLLLNASCMKPKHSHFEAMLTYIMLLSLSLLTAFLNLMVIISISHFRQLHTPTNLLLLSLAVSDFFISFLILFQIMLIDGCWFLGDVMCILYQYLAYVITAVSVETMVLISVDRYVAICDPLRYSTKITQKTVKICVCLCWICSVISPGLNLKEVLIQPGRYNSCFGECVLVLNFISGVIEIVVFFFVPITIIVVLYIRVFVVAVSQARAMRSHIAAVSLHSTQVTAQRSELKAARTLGVVVVMFLMCLCPYYCVALTNQDNLMSATSTAFAICLYYFNSCINPVIYALFYPWFRKSMKLIITLKILQPDSCETNMM
ncbi:trace amine-associated receptor 13c-like [Channa argus]|uniref:trace amine-associated receptor 13c-like n=1 Tax=Channa argus TaxID=215402 RepID=UPI003522FD6A